MVAPNPHLPFMAILNLPDVSKLINDPIEHDPAWLDMHDTIPLDIPKFEWKLGYDPVNHVISFHLWCSSNNIVEDFVRIFLFQQTLIGTTSKWYVNLLGACHATFGTITITFITYF